MHSCSSMFVPLADSSNGLLPHYGFETRSGVSRQYGTQLIEINSGGVYKDGAEDLVYQTFHEQEVAYSFTPFQLMQVKIVINKL